MRLSRSDGATATYERYRRALGRVPWPAAMIDLDGVDANVEALVGPVAAAKKTLRLASKSLRCVALTRYIARRGGDAIRGVMCFSADEVDHLASSGLDDLLVAYPTVQPAKARLAANASARGARVSLAVDCPLHLEIASEAARAADTTLGVVVDVDAAYRPAPGVIVGVRRSPLRTPRAIAELVEQAAGLPGLRFDGLLAYEAHIAGLPDGDSPLAMAAKQVLKVAADRQLRGLRRDIVDELGRRGIAVPLFNGGGSGSVHSSSRDPSLTEIAAGSGFIDSHLFDHYRDVKLVASVFFALEVTRAPAPGVVTCQSGGFIASGSAGHARLPIPALPEGLRLTKLEGAGEVQTPIIVPDGVELSPGSPVFFRHSKAGELAEHFTHYHLVRGDEIVETVPTYRGEGRCFY